MKKFENPTIKVSRFERSNILTASDNVTAVDMAINDADDIGAKYIFTLLEE